MRTFRTKYPNECGHCGRAIEIGSLAAADPKVQVGRVFHYRCFYNHIGKPTPADEKFNEKYGR